MTTASLLTGCGRLYCVMEGSWSTAVRVANAHAKMREASDEGSKESGSGSPKHATLSSSHGADDARSGSGHCVTGDSDFRGGEHQARDHATLQEHDRDFRDRKSTRLNSS